MPTMVKPGAPTNGRVTMPLAIQQPQFITAGTFAQTVRMRIVTAWVGLKIADLANSEQSMAVQRFEFDVDPNFDIHTSYHNDFFLLRTRVLVNGENTEIRSVREGKYEQPALNFCNSSSTICTTLSSITNIVSSFLLEYGVYHVDTFYYEQSPLFHVVFSSESCLRKFLQMIGNFKYTMELELLSTLSECLKSCRVCEIASTLHG